MSLDELQERLDAAEQVCILFGWASIYRTRGERDEALVQAWADWDHQYGHDKKRAASDPEWDQRIKDLARRRQETRESALAQIRGEEA